MKRGEKWLFSALVLAIAIISLLWVFPGRTSERVEPAQMQQPSPTNVSQAEPS